MRCDAIALLQPQPLWGSAAKERLSLRQAIEGALQSGSAASPGTVIAPTSLAAAASGMQAAQPAPDDALFMQELLLGMRVFDNYFLRSYDADAGRPLSLALLPAQKRVLDEAVRDIFRTASDGDLQRLLAIIDPDLLSLLPTSLMASRPLFAHMARVPAVHADTAHVRELPAAERLSIDEFLALVDYLHPYTYHYHMINGGLRLARYWGVNGLAEASALLREPYLRALHKLQRSGMFSDHTGLYAKGIVAHGHARRLSSTLDFLADRGGRIIPPHPVSATRWERQSFARQPGRPEDTTIFLKVPEGLDVTPFHGSLGKSLGEVILLPQPLRLSCQDDLPSPAATPRPARTYLLEAEEPALKQRRS